VDEALTPWCRSSSGSGNLRAGAILFRQSGGDVGALHRALAHYRLLCLAGGCSETWGIFSYEAGTFAELVTYGAASAANTRDTSSIPADHHVGLGPCRYRPGHEHGLVSQPRP